MSPFLTIKLLIIVFACIVVGFLYGWIMGLIVEDSKKRRRSPLWRGLEGAIVGSVGAFLGYVFMEVFVSLDIVNWVAFGNNTLLEMIFWIGVISAAFLSVVSGAGRVYKWKKVTGFICFPIDMTWGFLGTFLASLLYFVDMLFWWGGSYRVDDTENWGNYHIFGSGFRVKKDYVLTLGNVVSNGGKNSGDKADVIKNHEAVHVLQHRIFGPIFELTYISWLLVFGFIGGIVGLVYYRGIRGIGNGAQGWGYFSNPWEVWAYQAQGNNSFREGQPMAWPRWLGFLSLIIMLGSVVMLIGSFYVLRK